MNGKRMEDGRKKKKRGKTRRWYISGDALQLSPEQEQTRVRKNIGCVAMLAFLCVTSVTPRYKHGTRYMDTCITRGEWRRGWFALFS